MAKGSINFGTNREAIHNFAIEADAAWAKKQQNLYSALNNAVNLGRDGIQGTSFGFSADSPEDNNKVLGLLAGWLRYKGMSDDDIFSEVGQGSFLSAFKGPDGSVSDKRNDSIREFYSPAVTTGFCL